MSAPPDPDPLFSQCAIFPDDAASPRPSKRPRQIPTSQHDQINLEQLPLSQISPSKPPRPPSHLPVADLLALGDDGGEQHPFLQPDKYASLSSPPTPAGNSRTIPWRRQSLGRTSRCLSEAIADVVAKTNANEQKDRAHDAAHPPITEQILQECDIPSLPETSSSEEDQVKTEAKEVEPQCVPKNEARPSPRRTYRPPVGDSFEPTIMSQDSAYFSFSRNRPEERPQSNQKKTSTLPKSEPLILPSENDLDQHDDTTDIQSGHGPKRYYTRAFDYVINEVLERYDDILQSSDVRLAAQFRDDLSPNAQALFVRVYRRKQPNWYRLSALKESYEGDINIEEGSAELCNKGFVLSSAHVTGISEDTKRILTKQLIMTLDLTELRSACSALPDGKVLKKLSKSRLLPKLVSILSETPGKKRPRHRQTTLTGLSPAACLSKAIMKRVGHSIKIPEHVFTPLHRIHRLFFLEDGPESANIILAEAGKVKFPNYVCAPTNRIFPSSFAFTEFESAKELEIELDFALEQKNFRMAADLGGDAEVAVREFFDVSTSAVVSTGHEQQSESQGQRCFTSQRPARRRESDYKEAVEQLKHPFFRRYTALWVYVRACWHSVHALERLEEYETAVTRLKLLLSTGLMPRTRGKCLNRLTINLFKHMNKLEEPLDVILTALESKKETLHFGDLVGLANRGLQIHKKLKMPEAEERALANESLRTKSSRKKAALQEVLNSRPSTIMSILSRHETKIKIRKIYGKSLHIVSREEDEKAKKLSENMWHRFGDEASRDSVDTLSTQTKMTMGKAVFPSFRSAGGQVSVEEYVMEWYFGKEGWRGVHDEGKSIRFLFALFMWDCALFAPVPDVFQTPYQDKPLDLFTESFYTSRKEAIDTRLVEISGMSPVALKTEATALYELHVDENCIGCAWNMYSVDDISAVASGLGGQAMSHCFRLLSQDYSYWGAGLPDLTLWKLPIENDSDICRTKLVEVKSARDVLSEKQKAWLLELQANNADCEVCKVVERVTVHNEMDLQEAQLDSVAINAIDAAAAEKEPD